MRIVDLKPVERHASSRWIMSQIESEKAGSSTEPYGLLHLRYGFVKTLPLRLVVRAASKLLGRAGLAIIGNTRDHQLSIRPALAVAGNRIEPVGRRLLEERTDRLAGLLK